MAALQRILSLADNVAILCSNGRGGRMKRVVAALFILIGMVTLLTGCGSNKDKAALLDWLQSRNEDNTEMYFGDFSDKNSESLLADTLSEDDVHSLTDIFAKLSTEDLIQDKEPSKSSSMGYGLIFIDREKQYDNQYLIQAVSPDGEFEIFYQDKYWFIKNEELSNFILSLLQ